MHRFKSTQGIQRTSSARVKTAYYLIIIIYLFLMLLVHWSTCFQTSLNIRQKGMVTGKRIHVPDQRFACIEI